MVLHNLPQYWRRALLLLPLFIITVLLATGLYHGAIPRPKIVFEDKSTYAGPFHQKCGPDATGPPVLDTLPDIIRALWAPLVLPITAPKFTTLGGQVKSLPPPNELVRTESLGKRICILDIDNREFADKAGVFWKKPPNWDNLGREGAGFLSHYLYAMIHGYSYRFIRAPKYKDRAPHWGKVVFTKEMLKEFDIVITLDYDAMFATPQVPIEWLLNYWRIGPETLVAMAEDPPEKQNYDRRHRYNLNSGFIISQSSNDTIRLFTDWAECPSEKRYKGCSQWTQKLFHEQSAFSSYVRYDFLDGYSVDTHPQYIRKIPCDEANGYPEVTNRGCSGQFLRHYWADKHLTNREFNHHVMAAMTPLLAEAAFRQPGHVVDFRDKVLVGADILDKPRR